MKKMDELSLVVQMKLSAQRALLGQVTPSLRSVSMCWDEANTVIRVRYIFDGAPSDSVKDAALCEGTQIIADFPSPWTIDEEFVNTPYPEKMEHLDWLVFLRCEDAWVSSDA